MPSSVIRSWDYDEVSRQLTLIFQSGRRYVYREVPREVCDGLRRAFAKGDYFNSHIEAVFLSRRSPSSEMATTCVLPRMEPFPFGHPQLLPNSRHHEPRSGSRGLIRNRPNR
jgi:hypothetical protein